LIDHLAKGGLLIRSMLELQFKEPNMKTYDTAEYAHSRLAETIVRLGELPVYILSVVNDGNSIVVNYNNIMEDEPPKTAPLSDFNLDPVPLGYVNFKGKSTYLSRMPMRKDWRQGMRIINITDINGTNPHSMPYKVIGQTIIGKYPSFDRCIAALNRKVKPPNSIAFSRDFAIHLEGGLIEYKGMIKVGKVDLSNGDVTIDSKSSWVAEAFVESMETA
jgi:hypothetical protein